MSDTSPLPLKPSEPWLRLRGEDDTIPLEAAPRVKIGFHKSSTKDGGEGYSVEVLEGADPEEAQRVYDMAAGLREQAIAALKPPEKDYTAELEASLKGVPEKKHRDAEVEEALRQLEEAKQ